MRSQTGFESMVVVSSLMFILLAMTTYAYYISQDVTFMQQEADYFDTCSKLQAIVVSSSASDTEFVTYFLYNITLDADTLTAHIDNSESLCPLLLPVNGSIVVPSRWYYPINGTKFISSNGTINITWGWYT